MPKENEAKERDARRIVISRELAAPREAVWQAMTDPAQVGHWWGPRGFTTTTQEMDVRPGGVWRHVMHGPDGSNYPNVSVFTEVSRPERIVFTNGGRKEGGADVQFVSTWVFESTGKGTRVTISMVFPSAADRDRVARDFGAVEGAQQTLERLSEHLQATGAPAGDFVIERVFAAPREVVFKAWTEASSLEKWFGPTGCTVRVARLELRPGGVLHFCMRMPGGHEMWGKWVFREIVPPERIVLLNSFSDASGGLTRHPMSPDWPLETLSTVTLAEEGAKTRLTLRWTAHKPTEAERSAFDGGHESMKAGWGGTFAQLDAYLAS